MVNLYVLCQNGQFECRKSMYVVRTVCSLSSTHSEVFLILIDIEHLLWRFSIYRVIVLCQVSGEPRLFRVTTWMICPKIKTLVVSVAKILGLISRPYSFTILIHDLKKANFRQLNTVRSMTYAARARCPVFSAIIWVLKSQASIFLKDENDVWAFATCLGIPYDFDPICVTFTQDEIPVIL